MAGRPLKPATRHRLGEPLPHQLADRTRVPRRADCSLLPSGIWGISVRFQTLSPSLRQILTRYSPVRHYTRFIASYSSGTVQLACVKHAASVRPEPGSNSPLISHFETGSLACPLPLFSCHGAATVSAALPATHEACYRSFYVSSTTSFEYFSGLARPWKTPEGTSHLCFG